ncbi:glycosyltransferase, group 4 family [Dictyocaulus viviparus]|uniref:UDP-N-acetylglucosamine--dolichyl-phosphate N-acetylglucosaminephosphotransferase n=1 Tax=Dictyocaulus viviparus TaxID=29172 RepID=A0A0D8Y5L4_DICVI|nr:glycosyltransferase, group 4 family [Dictyocaulus viviparus]
MFWIMTTLTVLMNAVLSTLGYFACKSLIKEYIPIFIQRKMYGKDQCKGTDEPIPEPMGVISAAVYLIIMFLFIPFPFVEWIGSELEFPYSKFLAFLSGLISICTAILLGFADDVFDLKWRHKLVFPTLSSLPILMVYYVSGNSTTIFVPPVVRTVVSPIFPSSTVSLIPTSIDIQFLYYVFMCMVVVFCTNAINILAGVNGLECGQAIVVATSVALFNIVQYPARVFVGDTFCYWAGMTLAVVSILGHFSKTMILFLIPQVLNFLYSIPQLFKLVPCPRHRLPSFDCNIDKVSMSKVKFKESDLKISGRIVIKLLSACGLLFCEEIIIDGIRFVVPIYAIVYNVWCTQTQKKILNKNGKRKREIQLTLVKRLEMF